MDTRRKSTGTTEKKYRDICFQDAYELSKYCDNLGIEFMASVFDEERFEWLDGLGVKTHKIASRTSKNDIKLSEIILSDGKPTIISTGMHEFAEFPFGHSENIEYLFCVSRYPTYVLKFQAIKSEHPRIPNVSAWNTTSSGNRTGQYFT